MIATLSAKAITGKTGVKSNEQGSTFETAQTSIDIINYDVREVIAVAEKAAGRSHHPEDAFAGELSTRVLGQEGLRNRYLNEADVARGTLDILGIGVSIDQPSLFSKGRFRRNPAGGLSSPLGLFQISAETRHLKGSAPML